MNENLIDKKWYVCFCEDNESIENKNYTTIDGPMYKEKADSIAYLHNKCLEQIEEKERLKETLQQIIWDCENCDLACERCEYENDMTKTDIYYFAKKALENCIFM